MAREAKQSKQWDYEVKQMRMPHPITGQPTAIFANIRLDNNEILGETTEQYGLVQNKELIDVAIAALEKNGIKNFEQNFYVTGGGRKMFAEFTFKERQLATNKGDILGCRATLKNSFDRSISLAWDWGFIRLACLNGATAISDEMHGDKKHSKKVTVDFVAKALENAIARAPESLKIYDNLANSEVSDEQGKNILAHFENEGLLSGTLREAIEPLWLNPRRQEDKARNLYNLYNAITEHLTHKVKDERYEYSQRVNRNTLFALLNAARNKSRLDELITKIIVPIQIVTPTGPVLES